MKAILIATALSVSLMACAGGDLSSDQPDQEAISQGEAEVNTTIAEFKRQDPGIQRFFDESYGYIVFPAITQGGFGIGGAGGEGWVYERGRLVGKSEMTKVSVGALAGGQSYSQILFFKDKAAMDEFKTGDFELGADLSATILKEGATASAGYTSGIAVFVYSRGGIMAEASVGGQNYSFEAFSPPQ